MLIYSKNIETAGPW